MTLTRIVDTTCPLSANLEVKEKAWGSEYNDSTGIKKIAHEIYSVRKSKGVV